MGMCSGTKLREKEYLSCHRNLKHYADSKRPVS